MKKEKGLGVFSFGKRLRMLEERCERLEQLLLPSSPTAQPLAALVEDPAVPLSQVVREYLWGEE